MLTAKENLAVSTSGNEETILLYFSEKDASLSSLLKEHDSKYFHENHSSSVVAVNLLKNNEIVPNTETDNRVVQNISKNGATTLVVVAGQILHLDCDLLADELHIENVLLISSELEVSNNCQINTKLLKYENNLLQRNTEYKTGKSNPANALCGKTAGNIFIYFDHISGEQTFPLIADGGDGENGASGKDGEQGTHDSIITYLYESRLKSYVEKFDRLCGLLGNDVEKHLSVDMKIDKSENGFIKRLSFFENNICSYASHDTDGFINNEMCFQEMLTHFVVKTWERIKQPTISDFESEWRNIDKVNLSRLGPFSSIMHASKTRYEHVLLACEWTILIMEHLAKKLHSDIQVDSKYFCRIMQTLLVQIHTYLTIFNKQINLETECTSHFKEIEAIEPKHITSGIETKMFIEKAKDYLQVFNCLVQHLDKISLNSSALVDGLDGRGATSCGNEAHEQSEFKISCSGQETCPVIKLFRNYKEKISRCKIEEIKKEKRKTDGLKTCDMLFCLRNCQLFAQFLGRFLETTVQDFCFSALNFLDVGLSYTSRTELATKTLTKYHYKEAESGKPGDEGQEGGLGGCPGHIFVNQSIVENAKNHGKPGQKGIKGKNGKRGFSYNDLFKNWAARVWKQTESPEGQELDEHVVQQDVVPQISGQPDPGESLACNRDCKNESSDWGIQVLQKVFDSESVSPHFKHGIIKVLCKIGSMSLPLCSFQLLSSAYLNLIRIGRTHFSTDEHLQSESQFLSTLTAIYKNILGIYKQDCKSTRMILECCSRKRAAIELCIREEGGSVPDICKNLKSGLHIVEKFHSCKNRVELLTNTQKVIEEIDAKISRKIEQFGTHLRSNRLAESIHELFERQKYECLQELNAYLVLLKKDGRFREGTKIEEITEYTAAGIGGVAGGAATATAGGIGALPGMKIGAALGKKLGKGANKILKQEPGKFEVPNCLLPNLTLSPDSQEEDEKMCLDAQIEILKKVLGQPGCCKQLQDLCNSYCTPSNDDAHSTKENLYKSFLLSISKYKHLNTVWVPLAMTYCNLVVREQSGVPPKNKNTVNEEGSVIKVATQRIKCFPMLYESVLNCLLDLLTEEIGKGYRTMRPGDIQNIVFDVEAHLKNYTTGLPTQKNFELGFSKIKNLLDLYEKHWVEVDNLEKEKKAQATIADYSSLNLKLARIQYFTEAEILLLAYKHIRSAIIQWTFPHVAKYIEAVDCQIKYMERLYEPETEKSDELVATAAENCRDMIYIMLQLLEVKADALNNSWIGEDFFAHPQHRYFYKWPGSNKKNKEQETTAIRKLFQGQAVDFFASVDFSPEGCDVIKFDKTIGIKIQFKGFKDPSVDRSLILKLGAQNRLQQILENFVLIMVHSGESFYRVGQDKYLVQHGPLELMENASGNNSRFQNETKRRLTFFKTSPYTNWKLQLKPVPAGVHVKPKFEDKNTKVCTISKGDTKTMDKPKKTNDKTSEEIISAKDNLDALPFFNEFNLSSTNEYNNQDGVPEIHKATMENTEVPTKSTGKSNYKQSLTKGECNHNGTGSLVPENSPSSLPETDSDLYTHGIYADLIEFERNHRVVLYLVGKAKFCTSEEASSLKDKPEKYGVKKFG